MLTVNTEGALQIFSGGGKMIWSSNSTVSMKGNNTPLLQLLESGNLVVWDENSTKEDPVWQSFEYPGNTLLPEMKLGKDLVRGRERGLTSWKSPDDPSPGLYFCWLETNGYPQMFVKQGPLVLTRFGPWNGVKYQGLPSRNPNPIYLLELVNEREIYNKYEPVTCEFGCSEDTCNGLDGNTVQLNWINPLQDWVVNKNTPVDTCGPYGSFQDWVVNKNTPVDTCGPYGSFSIKRYPPCYCMDGFKLWLQDERSTTNWLSRCQRKKTLECWNGVGYRKLRSC